MDASPVQSIKPSSVIGLSLAPQIMATWSHNGLAAESNGVSLGLVALIFSAAARTSSHVSGGLTPASFSGLVNQPSATLPTFPGTVYCLPSNLLAASTDGMIAGTTLLASFTVE